jgi:hypothetical protein
LSYHLGEAAGFVRAMTSKSSRIREMALYSPTARARIPSRFSCCCTPALSRSTRGAACCSPTGAPGGGTPGPGAAPSAAAAAAASIAGALAWERWWCGGVEGEGVLESEGVGISGDRCL